MGRMISPWMKTIYGTVVDRRVLPSKFPIMKRAIQQLPRDLPGGGRGGFTLIEVITVIAILIILAGILIPSILSVQNRAKRAQTEALFGKIVNSLTLYYQDHGGYPDFSGNLSNGDVIVELNNSEQWRAFTGILAMSRPDGSAFENPQNEPLIKKFNPKRKRYFDLQLKELASLQGNSGLVDGFGNPNIVVVVDADLDLRIREENLPGSAGRDLRQPVAVYTRNTARSNFPEITSWDSF